MEKPRLIDGGLAVDDRGTVRFCNDFDFQEAGIHRFYTIENHNGGFIRAWHGHKKEAKYVTVLRGSAVICAAPLDAFKIKPPTLAYDSLSEWLELPDDLHRHVLSASKPEILYIPPGWANGTMNLTNDTLVVHFGTLTFEESGEEDDVRFPVDHFSLAWVVEQR